MEYFVISAKFVPLKYYTLSSQLRRLTSFSVGLFGSANSVTRSYPVMRKSCIQVWNVVFQEKGVFFFLFSISLRVKYNVKQCKIFVLGCFLWEKLNLCRGYFWNLWSCMYTPIYLNTPYPLDWSRVQYRGIYLYSPEKWLHNWICYPSNRSKQIQETHTAYSAGTQYTRQSLNEKQHTWLHRQQVNCLLWSLVCCLPFKLCRVGCVSAL